MSYRQTKSGLWVPAEPRFICSVDRDRDRDRDGEGPRGGAAAASVAFSDVANIHWDGSVDSLIDWAGDEASEDEAVQHLVPSIAVPDPAALIQDPFNNGSGTRQNTAQHGWTGHDGIRINAFGSQTTVRAGGSNESPGDYLAVSKYIIYIAGTRNSLGAAGQRLWGTNGSTRFELLGTGVRHVHTDAGGTTNTDLTVADGNKFTMVAAYDGTSLTVIGNGTVLVDESAEADLSSVGTLLELGYGGNMDATTVVCGAGNLGNCDKAATQGISDLLEAKRAA